MVRTVYEIFGRQVIADGGERGHVCDILFDDSTWALRYFVLRPDAEDDDLELLLPLHCLGDTDLVTHDAIPFRGPGRGFRALKTLDSDPPVSRQPLPARAARRPFVSGHDFSQNWGAISMPMITQWYFSNLCSAAERNTGHEGQRYDPHLRSGREVIGYRIQASNGKAGRVIDFLFDEIQRTIQYMVVQNRCLRRRTQVLLPTRCVRDICRPLMRVSIDLYKNSVRALPKDTAACSDSILMRAQSRKYHNPPSAE